MRTLITALLIISFNWLYAQPSKLDEKKTIGLLKEHISVLASDKFEGRGTGTKGEKLAADYIIKQFKSIGLTPLGTKDYLQEFTFTDGVKYDGKNNKLSIDARNCAIDKDFYPLPYSTNGKAEGVLVKAGFGIIAPKLDHNDYKGLGDLKGKIFVIELSSPDGIHPHSKYTDYSDIRQKIDTAIAKGAIGVIFINSDTTVQDPGLQHKEISKITPSSIPVIFVKGDLKNQLANGQKASIEVTLEKTKRSGRNVVAFLDNKAENTIIIGAHYDHLGLGDESSLYKGPPSIHNGADDNASGTAAIIELARHLKQHGPSGNNYLFIAFSGEEKGLIGSSYFSRNATIDLTKVNYMLNLDMVGRLKKEEKTLAIYGTGTSPVWKPVLQSIHVDSIKIKTVEAGIGPSDHTSFYLKDIPVLHFFSGFHPDYHKPSDDEDKINYEGEVSIIKYILTIIDMTRDQGKIAFTKTKEEPVASKNTSKPKVSMGVVPDYMFEGEGMKVDGVTEGKPAAAAGVKTGDIIVEIGGIKVLDMGSYMKALSTFKQGDKSTIKVKRGSDQIDLTVTF